jgi:hypothetical protein
MNCITGKNEVFEVGEKDSDGKNFTYTQINYLNGWADAKKYLPFKYDLVNIKFKNKTVHGWWDGLNWVGLKINPTDEAIQWKKKDYDE